MKNLKEKKYASLCYELLALCNVEQPPAHEIEAFVHDPDSSTFFKNTASNFISLWKMWAKRNGNSDQKNDMDNDTEIDGEKGIISLNKKDPRLKGKKFVPYSSLYGDYDDHESDEMPYSSFEKKIGKENKQAINPNEQVINPMDNQDVTDKEEEMAHKKNKENSKDKDKEKSTSERNSSAEPDNKTTPPPCNINAKEPDINNARLSVYFKLPNATCGKDYNSSFKINSDTHSKETINITQNNIDIITINGLETTGLTYNQDKKVINGIPARSGEINLEIIFRVTDIRKNHHTGETHKAHKTNTTYGTHKVHCLFIINPDPKSLWKDKPSDKKALFWKKDEDQQELMTDNGWRLIGASKRGRSHAHEGKCRDDHFFISADSTTKWNILAVADGAGSASLSREGARIAVTESSRILSEKLDEFDSEIIDILTGNNSAIHGSNVSSTENESSANSTENESSANSTENESSANSNKQGSAVSNSEHVSSSCSNTLGAALKKRLKDVLYNVFSLAVYEPIKVIHDTLKQHDNLKFRDFHTTLLLTAHKEIDGRHFVAAYWIGDGGIAVYCEDKSVTLLGKADSGEFAGQTRFLDNSAISKDDIYKRICFDYQDSITALILMTDGITDPFFETDHNLNQLKCWDNIWKETLSKLFSDNPDETGQNLLDWLDFWSQGNHDDRTVALMFKT